MFYSETSTAWLPNDAAGSSFEPVASVSLTMERVPPRRFFQNGKENAQGLLLSTMRLAMRAIDLVSETATVQPSWFLLANAR